MQNSDRNGNRLHFNPYTQQRSSLHPNLRVVESERVENPHFWSLSRPSAVLNQPNTRFTANNRIPPIQTAYPSYRSFYPPAPILRDQAHFAPPIRSSYQASHQQPDRFSQSFRPSFSQEKQFYVNQNFPPELITQKVPSALNQPYSREHLHCVRYLKEDLHLPWTRVFEEFHRIFSDEPGFIERETEAALTSRSYRDNFIYASMNGKPLLNSNGMPIRVQAKVRQRLVAEEKHIPFKLVEKHPSWAVNYHWVRPEHRRLAQAILDGADPVYYNSKKDQHRRVIEAAEQIEEQALSHVKDPASATSSSSNDPFFATPPASPEGISFR